MNSDEFLATAKQKVIEYFNEKADVTDKKQITSSDVFAVWFNYTLGNMKALFSTTVSDGMYYEITWNKEKNEMYFDAYKKWEHKCIKKETE